MENVKRFSEIIKGNAYPGRGIIIGADESGENAVIAYFITGRSENSRNRVFCLENGCLFTKPFDENKVKDSKLIIYRATAAFGNKFIVTNGDHTDTIEYTLKNGKSFEDALFSREYEPDAPNFTPRISGMINFADGDFSYVLSIIKKAAESEYPERFFFYYPKVSGKGNFIRTYKENGDPLPSFYGEPESLFIPSDMTEFADEIWDSLDENNKISLYVRYTDIKSGRVREIIKNKNER